MNRVEISFLVTCFNEQTQIINTLEKLSSIQKEQHLDSEIIVIDDCSTDDSYNLIRNLNTDQIIYTRHNENLGFGKTFLSALNLATKKFCIYIPADNDESKEDIIRVIKTCDNQFSVFPYFEKNKRTLFRKTLSRLYVYFINRITGYKLRYYNGINIYPTHFLKNQSIDYSSFAFQADCVLKILDNKLPYKTIPIDALFQDQNSSAFTLRNIFNTIVFILRLVKKYTLKI